MNTQSETPHIHVTANSENRSNMAVLLRIGMALSIPAALVFLDYLHADNPPPTVRQPATQPASAPATLSGVDSMLDEATGVRVIYTSPICKSFFDGVASLPRIEPRTIHVNNSERTYLSHDAWSKLAKEKQSGYREGKIDESRYYYTLYGTPLAYSRVLDLASAHGIASLEGRKVLDFGYGTIGHVRLMAGMGANVYGVDVDSLLPAIYSEPSDVSSITGPHGKRGELHLINGRFPADAEIRTKLGDGFDLFTSKNTLKRGYVHPAEKVDPRMTINLGASDEEFVRAVHDILKPGGLAIIYNICPAPAPAGEPYIPWADGRCPFARELWETNGFEVIAFDVDDTPFVHRMARALKWDQPPQNMTIEGDLFATYTIARKKK